MVVCAGATGVAFGISPPAGFVLAGITVIVFVAFMLWAFRQGRRAHEAGQAPDLAGMEARLRSRAKWLTVLAVVAVAASALGLATGDGHVPTWLFVAPPVLLVLGLIQTWLLVGVFLPRLQRQQATRSE
jgi:hypothetical protein